MKIRVLIADQPLSVVIDKDDEEVVRRAAKIINDNIAKSRKEYDCSTFIHLAMAALTVSCENEQSKKQYKYSVERIELEALAKSVEKALAE